MTNQSQWSPPELEAHTLVLLRWPDELPELTEAELDALQAEHVAYQLSLRQRGIIAAGGRSRISLTNAGAGSRSTASHPTKPGSTSSGIRPSAEAG